MTNMSRCANVPSMLMPRRDEEEKRRREAYRRQQTRYEAGYFPSTDIVGEGDIAKALSSAWNVTVLPWNLASLTCFADDPMPATVHRRCLHIDGAVLSAWAKRQAHYHPDRLKTASKKNRAPTGFSPSKRPAAPRAPKLGNVYFIQAKIGGPVKIGFAVSISHRLASLQTASAEELVVVGGFPATMDDERFLHRHFEKHWARGEWFEPNSELQRLIGSTQGEFHLGGDQRLQANFVSARERLERLCRSSDGLEDVQEQEGPASS